MSLSTQLHQRATVGIITALPKEFSAVELMLQSPVVWSARGEGAGRRYLLGEIPAVGSGTHVVALALLTEAGTTSAAVRASTLLHHFPSVRHIIMCGIAGGIPSPTSPEDDIRLGDIVVSDRMGVVNYDFIKQTPDQIKEYHPPLPPGAELLEAVRFLEAKRIMFQRPWEPHLDRANQLEDAARPRDNQGADGKPIDYPLDPKRRPGLPRLFYGPIASANRLLKDETFRDELRRRSKIKAVEMEGSGIADASWLSDRAGYLVVRGICDFCDMRKGDLWQGYAAVSAAAYVRALLESMPASAAHAEPIDASYPPHQHFHSEQRTPAQPLPNGSHSSDANHPPQTQHKPGTSESHQATETIGAKPNTTAALRPSSSGSAAGMPEMKRHLAQRAGTTSRGGNSSAAVVLAEEARRVEEGRIEKLKRAARWMLIYNSLLLLLGGAGFTKVIFAGEAQMHRAASIFFGCMIAFNASSTLGVLCGRRLRNYSMVVLGCISHFFLMMLPCWSSGIFIFDVLGWKWGEVGLLFVSGVMLYWGAAALSGWMKAYMAARLGMATSSKHPGPSV